MTKGPDINKVSVSLERLPIGERIKDGDFWYFSTIEEFIMFEEAPRNFLGMRKKVGKHHAPVYRVVGLKNKN